MILNVDPQLSQWDVGRSVRITDSNATHMHFANPGDSIAPIIEITDGSAKIPDYLLQTGKALIAYAVLNGVTQESRTFSVRKRERPESYVYEHDQRNYIYKLIADAETAVAEAKAAAKAANEIAGKATGVTDSANQAAQAAAAAAETASQAATNAGQTAKSLMVVGEAKGTNISLDDAARQILVGLRIFGKTTQTGTPTPETPAELVSTGDGGSITVNVTGGDNSQSMTIATPNGLPGIRVTSGGNYTDANGQQWICDEIDMDRGVYVQRIKKAILNGNSIDRYTYNTMYGSAVRFDVKGITTYPRSDAILCTHLQVGSIGSNNAEICNIHGSAGYPIIQILASRLESVDASGLQKYLASNPITIYYVLDKAIESAIPEEELAAFSALHTNRPDTTIYNDAAAYMYLEYIMDAKIYIDRLVRGSSSWLTSVTLRASSWKGSESLYSQVITINGITKYSKVDLLPSVEQLAVFYNKNVAFVTENEGGVVTVYAIGEKPTNDYTMQAQITEVNV